VCVADPPYALFAVVCPDPASWVAEPPYRFVAVVPSELCDALPP